MYGEFGECLSCNLFIAVSIGNHYWMVIIKLKCLLLCYRFLFMLPCLYFAVIWGGFWWALSVGQPVGHPGFPTPESSEDLLLLEMPCWSGTKVPSSLSSQASPSSPHTSRLLLKNTRSNSQDSVENIFSASFPESLRNLPLWIHFYGTSNDVFIIGRERDSPVTGSVGFVIRGAWIWVQPHHSLALWLGLLY